MRHSHEVRCCVTVTLLALLTSGVAQAVLCRQQVDIAARCYRALDKAGGVRVVPPLLCDVSLITRTFVRLNCGNNEITSLPEFLFALPKLGAYVKLVCSTVTAFDFDFQTMV